MLINTIKLLKTHFKYYNFRRALRNQCSFFMPIMYSEEENEKVYKATQGQRRLEREIHKLKKEKAAMKAIGDNDAVKAIDYKLQQKFTQIDNYCDARNLKRDYSRELVSEQIVKNNLTTLSDNDNIELQTANNIERVKNFNLEEFSDEVNQYIKYMDNLLKSYQEEKISLEEALELSKNIYNGVEQYGIKFKEY